VAGLAGANHAATNMRPSKATVGQRFNVPYRQVFEAGSGFGSGSSPRRRPCGSRTTPSGVTRAARSQVTPAPTS